MPYSFFFSYSSQDDAASEGMVTRFYERLHANLQIAHGNHDSYFAPRSNKAGADWTRKLRDALNESRVLVCLQSPSYFQSDQYCGREFEVFLQRRKLHLKPEGAEPPDCIVPVLWSPLTHGMPRAVPNKFQGMKPSEDFTPFEEDSLYEAIANDKTERRVINRYSLYLAKRISNLLMGPALPAFSPMPDLDAFPSAFRDPNLPEIDHEKGRGPWSVTIMYPSSDSLERLPWGPPPPNAVIWAAALAKSKERIFQGARFGSAIDFEPKIRSALEMKSPVVLMVTEAVLGDRDLQARFSQFFAASERRKGVGTIVLVQNGGAHIPDCFPDPTRVTQRDFESVLSDKLANLRTALLGNPTSEARESLPGFPESLPGF
jgi:TIR domain